MPAEANILVTCRRLNNDEPEVVEISRDDTATSAFVITPPATKGLWNIKLYIYIYLSLSLGDSERFGVFALYGY